MKLVDTLDLGSSIRKNVGVQLPPSPPINLGEMAEWSKAAVLKADDPSGSGGSNPSLAAIPPRGEMGRHERLKISCLIACWFESSRGDHIVRR